MIGQRPLAIIAVTAGLASGLLFYAGAQRVPVVVAVDPLTPGRAIGASEVGIREVPPDSVPAGALTTLTAAIGRYPKAPLWPGQLLISDAIAQTTAGFGSGLVPPTGYRAIAIPVTVERALGGAVWPGSRIDVIAVPREGRSDESAELVIESALVLDVRGEHGGSVGVAGERVRGSLPFERLASVVVAVGRSDELALAERIATSSFVLVLVPGRP